MGLLKKGVQWLQKKRQAVEYSYKLCWESVPNQAQWLRTLLNNWFALLTSEFGLLLFVKLLQLKGIRLQYWIIVFYTLPGFISAYVSDYVLPPKRYAKLIVVNVVYNLSLLHMFHNLDTTQCVGFFLIDIMFIALVVNFIKKQPLDVQYFPAFILSSAGLIGMMFFKATSTGLATNWPKEVGVGEMGGNTAGEPDTGALDLWIALFCRLMFVLRQVLSQQYLLEKFGCPPDRGRQPPVNRHLFKNMPYERLFLMDRMFGSAAYVAVSKTPFFVDDYSNTEVNLIVGQLFVFPIALVAAIVWSLFGWQENQHFNDFVGVFGAFEIIILLFAIMWTQYVGPSFQFENVLKSSPESLFLSHTVAAGLLFLFGIGFLDGTGTFDRVRICGLFLMLFGWGLLYRAMHANYSDQQEKRDLKQMFLMYRRDGVGPRVIKKLRKARTELNASEFCHLMLETVLVCGRNLTLRKKETKPERKKKKKWTKSLKSLRRRKKKKGERVESESDVSSDESVLMDDEVDFRAKMEHWKEGQTAFDEPLVCVYCDEGEEMGNLVTCCRCYQSTHYHCLEGTYVTDPLDWICTDCVGANPEELAGRAPDAEEIDLAFMLGNLTDADAGDRSQAPTVVREESFSHIKDEEEAASSTKKERRIHVRPSKSHKSNKSNKSRKSRASKPSQKIPVEVTHSDEEISSPTEW